MKKFFIYFFTFTSLILSKNSYSQQVGVPNTYLDNDDGDSNCIAINSSFLNVTHHDDYLEIKIPVFFDDDGSYNDYMNKLELKYLFYNDDAPTTYDAFSPNNPILDLRKNFFFGAGFTFPNSFTVPSAQGDQSFWYNYQMVDPNNNNAGSNGLDGQMHFVGYETVYSEGGDDYAWELAVFKWAVPSWAIEDYNKLDLLLHIDFEDNSDDRFEFDGEYDPCHSYQFLEVNDNGYDEDCDGPEWEIKNIPQWKPYVNNLDIPTNPVITNSDYQVGINISGISDPITSNDSNPYSYLLYNSEKYYFTGSKDPYNGPSTDPSTTLPGGLINCAWNTHNKFTDQDENFKANLEPGDSETYRFIYYESGYIYGAKKCTLKIDVTADNLKQPSSLTASSTGAKKVTLNWVKGTDRPNSDIKYRVERKCTSGCNVLNSWESYDGEGLISGSTLTATDNCVEPAATYEYRVQTVRVISGSETAWSSWRNSTSVSLDDLPTVSNLTYTLDAVSNINQNGFIINNADFRTINIDWSDASQNGFNNSVYKVIKTVGSASTVLHEDLSSSNFTDDVSKDDLCNGINYKIYYKATNSTCTSITHTSNDYSQISVQLDEPTKIIFNTESTENGISLSWPQQLSNPNIDYYTIYRDGQLVSNGDIQNSSDIFSVLDNGDPSQTYTDTDPNLINCESYDYQIRTHLCGVSTLSDEISQLKTVNITDPTWVDEHTNNTSQKQLFASKGKFTNRVEVSWENNNNSFISHFEIERRELSENINLINDFEKISESSNDIHHFTDYNAEANKLYEYRIVALVPTCNDLGQDEYAEYISWISIGFRTPYSSIYGQITYDGVGAVENAEVFAAATNPLLNKSFEREWPFYTDPNGCQTQNINDFIDATDLNMTLPSSFSIMAWLKFDELFTEFNLDCSSSLTIPTTLFSFEGSQIDDIANIESLEELVMIDSDSTILYKNFKSTHKISAGWNQITFTCDIDENEGAFYLNGEKILDIILAPNSLLNSNEMYLFPAMNGKIDELSIWELPLDEEFIKRNYDKFIKHDHEGLLAYYHFDEGIGNIAYDATLNSYTTYPYGKEIINYYHLDISFNSSSIFSDDSPSANQIKYKGYSDINGYYTIDEIRYPSSGSNYQVTPTLPAKYSTDFNGNQILMEPAHEFSPLYLTAFLGDGIDYLSNYNFTDISSFDVSGNVYYLDPSMTDDQNCTDSDGGDFQLSNDVYIQNCNTSLPNTIVGVETNNVGVEGVFILVDKEPVYDQNGNQVATAADGSFSLKVPIGMHEISIQMDDHTFVSNVWNSPNHISVIANENSPEAETRRLYNFIENKQGLTFYDNSKRRLVGRVCGGTTEANKPYDGTSINNIGQAFFTLKNEGTEFHSVVISTNDTTGEYFVDLLPISYQVKNDETAVRLFDVPSHEFEGINSVNNYFLSDMGNDQPYPFAAIDLSQKGDSTQLYDWAENFVYRVTPSISYFTSMLDHDQDAETDSLAIVGESDWTILNTSWNEDTQEWEDGDDIVIPLIKPDGITQLSHPIFKKDVPYLINTSIQEVYYKYAGDTIIPYNDPVSFGTLTLNDGRSSNSYEMDSTKTLIPFETPEVNTSLNGDNSFEKSFTLTYSDGPVSIDKNQDYYVFGSQVNEGLNFFSSGPELVEMVLRDPPGDQSYSYIENGSSVYNEVSISSIGDVESDHIDKDINLGTTLQIAIPFGGPILTTEIIANTQVDILAESFINETEITTYQGSNSQAYQTSSEEFNIGSGGDLYIANNYNMVYGTNKFLEIVKVEDCSLQGYVCYGETSETPNEIGVSAGVEVLYTDANGIDYTLGTSVGLEIVPVGFQTKTVYDQNHIVRTLIPTLETIRNTYFGMEEVYTFTADSCFDNLAHHLYNKNLNPNPCYTYNEAADLSDPYELPFNVFEDIDIADYIPDGFIGLIEEVLMKSQTNGEFNGFTEGTLTILEETVSAAEQGQEILGLISQITDSQFWTDFGELLGGQNLLLGMEAFKENVIDYYADQLTDFTDGMSMLTSVLGNMTHTVPKDKVAFYNQQINLWKAAVAANEEDKASIFDDAGSQSSFVPSMLYTETFGPDDNYSFSAGNVIEETTTVSESTTSSQEVNFTIDGEIAYEIGAKINGLGGAYSNIMPITFASEKNINDTESNYITFGYVLSDNDESDYISVDVKESNNGWGPIFRKRAGQTMCPHEAEEPFLYYDNGGEDNVFSPATQPREVPGIDINPKTLSGVPETEQAVFTLSLTNNSAATQDMVYTLMIDEGSNPDGAILNIDGQSVHREIMVPYGETITKTLTVEKGPERLVYSDSTDFGGNDDRLGIILRSSCQYAYGTSNIPDIADTVYLAVSYMAGCTDISISQPSDAWVLNKSTEDDTTGASVVNNLNIKLDAYDWNYYSLEDIILQYKKSNQPDNAYNAIETFIKFEDGEEIGENDEELPLGSVNLAWDMYGLEDGDYDIRAYTNCNVASVVSEVHSGHKDTRLPEPFGSPQPADGILSPNDEIQMNWSEAIDENRFYSAQTNITMSAIKNMSEVSHDAFVYMDAGSILEIPYGLNLQNNSFTVEMWINPETPGTLFKQGQDNNRLSVFINTDNTLGVQYESSGDIVSASSVTSIAMATDQADAWQHVAFVFDNDLKTISFIINGSLVEINDATPFLCDYIGEGAVTIGGDAYQGAMHELRVWSTNKYATSIYQTLAARLSAREAGLKGYWPMDELSGTPQDLSRSRHMTGDVNWAVAKKGFGYDFASNGILNAPFGTKAYEATDDFTMEFWFKSSGVNECMVSTGSYYIELEFGNIDTWSIGLDGQGHISIDHNLNNGSTLLMNSSESFNDGLWHHLSIVKNAKSTTTLFVDGIEQASCSSELTRGFGSPQLTLGARQYRNSADYEYSEYFSGKIDEFRLWNLKRNFSQLNRYKNIRLNGTELGLDVYYPFEQYENIAGVTELMETFADNADTLNFVLENEVSASYESSDLPLVRMSNPYLEVFHNSLNNQDQTLLSITEDLANVEGTIIDVSMDNLFDLYGNKANPVTWSFYVNKNQLVWDETSVSIEKSLGEPIVFESMIMNQGGSVESYEMTNLPSWLSANPSQGVLGPNSYEQITFVIDETLFIGDYSEQVLLTGNNGISESLRLQVNVEAEQPEISLTEQDYQYNMSFIGKVSVDGIRSRDELDLLVAYVGDEPRGMANPMYIEDYDAYFIFMSVYSNEQLGEEVNFRLWDASEGKIQSQVRINSVEQIDFVDGSVNGSFEELAHFEATNTLRQEILLSEGWNWLSLNLEADDGSETGEVMIPTVTAEVNSNDIGVFRTQNSFAQYNESVGWLGSMGSVQLGNMYQIKINNNDTLIYDGVPVDLSNPIYNIDIVEGWNWIGYLGQRPLDINTALSSLSSIPGDLIKSQMNFSVFASESLGWLGTLNFFNEGEGYMLKSTLDQTLIYPESSLYGSGSFRLVQNHYTASQWEINPNKYEYSLSIIAEIVSDINHTPAIENVLGAFKGLECVGNVSVTEINSEKSLYFLTVYGNQEDQLYFSYFHVLKDKTYQAENRLIFEPNALIGSIDNPYPIEINMEVQDADNYFALDVYPNPFEDVFTLEFFLEKTSKVTIELHDIMGRMIESINEATLLNGTHKIDIDTELNKGVYFIELDIDGNTYQKKLIKQ